MGSLRLSQEARTKWGARASASALRVLPMNWGAPLPCVLGAYGVKSEEETPPRAVSRVTCDLHGLTPWTGLQVCWGGDPT